MTRIAVSSRIFHMLPHLRDELVALHPEAKFNAERAKFTEDEFIAFADGAEIALIGLEPITDKTLAALPALRIVSACSVGLDHVDPQAMKRHGVKLGWTAGVNKVSVAELTIAMMIGLLRKMHPYNAELLAGGWPRNKMGLHLRGRIVGIHGCGNIGKELVRLLRPFGVEILACDRLDFPDFYAEYGVAPVSAEELWARSEVLTIHLPKNASTIGMYDAAALDKLRPGCFLVNTSRGGIVDERALAQRLADGRIAAAAIDVFAVEPLADLALAGLPNVAATPHIGGSAREAWEAMGRAAMRAIETAAVPQPGVYPFD